MRSDVRPRKIRGGSVLIDVLWAILQAYTCFVNIIWNGEQKTNWRWQVALVVAVSEWVCKIILEMCPKNSMTLYVCVCACVACMYVYVYVCIRTCMYGLHACMCVRTYVRIACVYLCVRMCACVLCVQNHVHTFLCMWYACTYEWPSLYLRICPYVCTSLFMHVLMTFMHVYVCVRVLYVYVYVYVHVYVYFYVYV